MNWSGLRIVKCPRRLPPRVTEIISRGREYYYYRETRTKKVRLFGYPYDRNGLPDQSWWSAYRQLSGTEHDTANLTLLDLVSWYFASPEWLALSPATRRLWRPLLLAVARWWPRPVAKLDTQHVYALRDRYSATPATANNIVRSLSAMLSWAVDGGLMSSNPCLNCRRLALPSRRKYEAWTKSDIARLKSVAPPTIWRVVQIVLLTAQPLRAVLALTWADIDHEGIHFQGSKEVVLPITERMRAVIDALPRRSKNVLLSDAGRPWTRNTFRIAWHALMSTPEMLPLKRAGLVFFGLRRTAIIRFVEAGCTEAEVSALTGLSWKSLDAFFRAREQRLLADAGIARWSAATSQVDQPRKDLNFKLRHAVVTRRLRRKHWPRSPTRQG